MKKREEKTTYAIRLLCRNCEEDWMEEIEKGTYVRCEKDNNYMIKMGEPYKKRKLFTCPECGAHTKITRRPLIRR